MRNLLVQTMVAAILTLAQVAYAAQPMVDDVQITLVAANGGSDTVNPGTTCIQISSGVSAACAYGYIAIPNNNGELLAAALAAKTSNSNTSIYYQDDASTLHCPGKALTTCSLISIFIR